MLRGLGGYRAFVQATGLSWLLPPARENSRKRGIYRTGATLRLKIAVQAHFEATLRVKITVQAYFEATLRLKITVQAHFEATLRLKITVQAYFEATLRLKITVQKSLFEINVQNHCSKSQSL